METVGRSTSDFPSERSTLKTKAVKFFLNFWRVFLNTNNVTSLKTPQQVFSGFAIVTSENITLIYVILQPCR
jgi:hypothetical protein